MNVKTAANLYVSQEHTDLISIFIQYHRGELNPMCEIEVQNVIQNCKECESLYNEISKFYNQGEVLLYEIQNEEEILDGQKVLKSLNKNFPGDDYVNQNNKNIRMDLRNCCS